MCTFVARLFEQHLPLAAVYVTAEKWHLASGHGQVNTSHFTHFKVHLELKDIYWLLFTQTTRLQYESLVLYCLSW